MKKMTFLLLGLFLMLGTASAAIYNNLYVVGNACDAGWDMARALEMTQVSDGVFTWTGNLLHKDAGDNGQIRFKFLVARDWHPSLTSRTDVLGHTVISSGVEYDLNVRYHENDGEDNAFQVAETGIYTVIINLNVMKMTCAKEGDVQVEEPEIDELYIVGSGTNENGEWDYTNPIEMTQVGEGEFLWTGFLYNTENGREFKFLNRKETWDKTINPIGIDTEFEINVDYNLNFRPYESTPNDYKFLVPATGEYTVSVDLIKMKMHITAEDDGNNLVVGTLELPFEIVAANGVIDIIATNNSMIQSIKLFDLSGRSIKGKNLSTGIYILKVKCNNEEYIQKIMMK